MKCPLIYTSGASFWSRHQARGTKQSGFTYRHSGIRTYIISDSETSSTMLLTSIPKS
jgi:hypothetical protein